MQYEVTTKKKEEQKVRLMEYQKKMEKKSRDRKGNK